MKPLFLAVLAGSLALASALLAAGGVRHIALKTSRQQPSPETLFEPATPTSPALVAQGRKLFLDSCAHCHGADATGDDGPDLHGLEMSDRHIATTISRGIKGEMPSFAKKHNAADLSALLAYVRTLK